MLKIGKAGFILAGDYIMKIIEYFSIDNKEYWLSKIKECDWSAGQYLYELLRNQGLKSLVGENTKVLMLADGENLVSFCTFADQDDVPSTELTPWIGWVYTFPKYRGNHYVGKLLKYAEVLAQAAAMRNIYISTNHVGLYEKYGYEFFQMMKDIHGEDSRVYVKQINLKVIIIGSPGAGKSTFARRLREVTNLPLYYLDMLWHKPDKTNISREEFDIRLNEIVQGDKWIIDGNYQRTLEVRLRQCNTVFLMDFPLEVCLLGAKSRIGNKREDLPWIETELDEDFERFIIDFPRNQLPQIYELLEKYQIDKNIVIFQSREEVDNYLKIISRD